MIICKFNKPVEKAFRTSSLFFSIYPVKHRDSFELFIKVNTFFKVKAFEDNLVNNSLITPFKLKKFKKLIIIASNKRLNSTKNRGLNFYFWHSPKIYIGAIDENGNPLNIVKSEDVIKYFSILKRYKANKDVLYDIDNFLQEYSNSIFIPDILFLKMNILDKQGNSQEVVDIAKKWIKNYSYDDNLPKVLLLIAKNYTKMGFLTDATYFYQRIIDEYRGSDIAYLAMIYLADQLYITGDDKKAFELYQDALIHTKNIQTASLAAERIAQRYLDKGNIKDALIYYNKIYKVNKEFLLNDKLKALQLAKSLASHQAYDFAIKILRDLITKIKKTDNLYEEIEYYLALWNYDKGDYKSSLKWINSYLNQDPYGNYADKLKDLRDKVLFEVNDLNLTKQLQFINYIMKKYKNTPIYSKAFVKKVKLLYKMKDYKEILAIYDKIKSLPKDIFKDKDEFLNKVLKEYVIELLNSNSCLEFDKLIKKYKVILDKKYDDKVFNCLFKVKDFEKASIVCNKYLDSTNNDIFIKWIKRKILVLDKLEDYKNEILAIDDLCAVYKKCYRWLYMKFNALWKLKRYDEALKLAQNLEKYNNIKNLDVYNKIVNYAIKNKNSLLAATYALKMIELQYRFKVYPYSPFVEFTYVSYSNNKNKKIAILEDLIKRVKGEDLARAYYLLADLTKNKKYLLKCEKVKESKLWKGLCQEALKLY